MPAPCPDLPKELRSAQALMHGAESALTQGLDKRSLVMVLLVSLSTLATRLRIAFDIILPIHLAELGV